MKASQTLATLRQSTGLTLGQLAERLKTSKPNLSNFETGKTDVSPEFIARYAQAVGIGRRKAEELYWAAVARNARARLRRALEAGKGSLKDHCKS